MDVVVGLSVLTSHVQNEFRNLENYNINLIIILTPIVIPSFLKDIKLF